MIMAAQAPIHWRNLISQFWKELRKVLSDLFCRLLKLIKRRWISLGIIASIFMFFATPPLVNGYILPYAFGWLSTDWRWFVVQTFSGNWSPGNPRPTPFSAYWFSIFAEFAVILNFAAFAFLLGLLKRVRDIERRQIMNLKEAFDVWRENAKFEVAQALAADEKTTDIIDEAIDKSSASLRPLLVAAYGKQEVDSFFQKNE
jgi:hypothetical protein